MAKDIFDCLTFSIKAGEVCLGKVEDLREMAVEGATQAIHPQIPNIYFYDIK